MSSDVVKGLSTGLGVAVKRNVSECFGAGTLG